MTPTANCYARALFDLSVEKNNLEDIHLVLEAIKNLVRGLPDFCTFLNNRLLDKDEKKQVLQALFEGKISDDVYKFLLFITYKNRLNILPEIVEAFDGLYLSHKRQMRVWITTAFAIQEEDKAALIQRMEEQFKQSLVPQWRLDPSLLGGFHMAAQGVVYDYSFKNQLNHFYQEIVNAR